jgi:hypothetical protein
VKQIECAMELWLVFRVPHKGDIFWITIVS